MHSQNVSTLKYVIFTVGPLILGPIMPKLGQYALNYCLFVVIKYTSTVCVVI